MKKSYFWSNLWLVLVCIFLVAPILASLVYSFSTNWLGIFPTGFTIQHYVATFADGLFVPSLIRSVVISIIPILLTGTIVILALYTSVIYSPKLEKYIQFLCMIPYTVQGIILATSVLSLYAGSSTFLSNRIVMLTLLYCIVILPFTYQGIRNSMYSINIRQIIEAAEILGANKLTAFIRVVLPNMVSGIIVSSLLSMVFILGDFAIIRVIASGSYVTAQMMLFNSRTLSGQRASVIVMIIFATTLILTSIVLNIQNREKKQAQPKE